MRLPSAPTAAVVAALNTSFFNAVWNASDSQGRANFALSKVADRIQTGSVPINLSVVGLPTTDAVYAVYSAPAAHFGRFVSFKNQVWVNDSSVLTQTGVSITSYTAGGRMIPAGTVWCRYDHVTGMVMVAIDVTYTRMCAGSSYPALYLTVQLDTTRTTPMVTSLFRIHKSQTSETTVATVTSAIRDAVLQHPKGTTVTINGWRYDASALPALTTNDVIEIRSDPDVIGWCDISVDDNITGYHSVRYGEYREVLHIPKALNSKTVITVDTLDAVVMDAGTKKGVTAIRIDSHALESVTHNDVSISRQTIQALQTSLGAQAVIVRLYVRLPNDRNTLGSDVNRISDLYTLSDQAIVAQLTGQASQQIPEWTAAHLEQSSYLDLLYQFTGFDLGTAFDRYIKAFGYYDVAAMIGQCLHYYTYQGGAVEITKPARLFGYRCQVMVYVNGRKLRERHAVISQETGTSFMLGFAAGLVIPIGARVTVYVSEAGLRTPVAYAPTASAPSIRLDSDDYTLYREIHYTDPQAVHGGTTTTGYQALAVSAADYTVTIGSTGQVTYTVLPQHYGQSFTLVPRYGLTTAEYALDATIAAKQAIILPLTTIGNTTTQIPVLGDGVREVYINGYRLIPDVDFTCTPVLGANNDVLQTVLVVANCAYIAANQTGNILEVVHHGDAVASQDVGYAIRNTLHRSQPPMVWSKTAGRAFVRGVLVDDVTSAGNSITVNTPVDDGAPYLLEWNLSYGAAKLLSGYSATSDLTLRTRIDMVLGTLPISYPTTVVVSRLYALYSPFLATIVSAVGHGQLVVVNDPKDDQFLRQFQSYRDIYARDPVLKTTNPGINRQFVTIAAHYANYAVTDATQMLLIQRLNALLLNPPSLSILEVLT